MVFLVSFAIFLSIQLTVVCGNSNTLLVISMDGMSWEVVKNRTAFANISNILHVVDNGVSADNMKNVFPTKTWPNHISLLTGLYPINHGFVSNSFWDPELKEIFQIETKCSSYDPRFYTEAEQIWMTYQKQGGRSAVYFWPGFSSYEIKPSYYEKEICYVNCTANRRAVNERGWQCRPNFSKPFDERVDKIVGWMKTPAPPKFIAFYIDEPDWKLHQCGYCQPYREAIELVDQTGVGYLLDRLKQEGLLDKTNIVLTSDHGFLPVKEYLYLEDFLTPIPRDAVIVDDRPSVHIWPSSEEQLENIYNVIKGKDPRVSVYKKSEIPEELNWRDNDRIPPLVAMAAKGYVLQKRRPASRNKATHGWSQKIPAMWSMFAAMGPDFKRKYKIKKDFQNIDLYPLFCHLLGIEPNPNDGNIENVAEMLVNPPTKAESYCISSSAIGMTVMCISSTIIWLMM